MKALVLDRYGTPDVLQLREVDTPALAPGGVLVRVHAASVNDWDWEMMRGDLLVIRVLNGYSRPRVRILGCDIAGSVEAVGREASRFKPGDEVYGDVSMNGFGAFAEYVCCPETSLAPKPAGMTFEQAAAIPQAGMLAVQGLIDVGRIQRNHAVLLNGAGGGVGTLALQIAKQYDAHVTVVDKHSKLELLRRLGADETVDYEQEDFTERGRAYDLILDTKTNRSPFSYLRTLNPGGTYATVGGSISRLIQIAALGPAIGAFSRKRVRIVGLKPNKDLAYVNQLFEAGALLPIIDRTFQLADSDVET